MISEIANLFLNDENTPDYSTAIKKIYEFEEYDGTKEIFEFSKDELIEYLCKCLEELSEMTINSYVSAYNKYFSWLEKNNKHKFNYSYSDTFDQLKSIIKENINVNFFSRKEIYDLAYSEDNAQDGIIILLLFEGISGGKKDSEIMNLKKDDLINTRLVMGDRSIETPKDFSDLYKKASSQKTIKKKNRYGTVETKLFECDYLIRNSKNEEYKDRNNTEIFHNMFHKKRKNGLDIKEDTIKLSGICFYISLLEQLKGSLVKEDYLKVMDRYNYEHKISVSPFIRIKDLYKKYKRSNKIESVDTNLYYNVYSDILNNVDELTKQDSADKELGDLGEQYIYTLLKRKYGSNNVYDETKNGVGYDFSVNYNGKIMYEVKSTSRTEGEDLRFFMTIKELKSAYTDKERYKLCIVYFDDREAQNTYLISNPINILGIEKQAESLISLEDEGICIPLEAKITVDFKQIKKYKDNSLKK